MNRPESLSRSAAPLLAAVIVLAAPFASARAADREEAHYNVAVTLYNAGKWQAAVKKIDQRLAQDLSKEMRARYLYAKGLAFERGGRADDARKAYATVVRELGKSAEADKARLAMVYLDHAARRSQAVVDACSGMDRRKLDKTQRRDVALMYAEALYALDRPADAGRAYDAAVKAGVDPTQVAAKSLELAVRLDQHERVLALTGKPVAGMAADLVKLLRAEAFLARGKWDEAAKEAAAVPKNSPHAGRAAFARARALLKLGRTEQAIEPLQRAIAAAKEPPISAHVALADCLVRHKRTDEADDAVAAARKAVEAMPAKQADRRRQWDARLTLLTIQLASDRGEHERVASEIDKRRASLPKNLLPQAIYMRLHALRKTGDDAAILATMGADMGVLAGTEYDAPAVAICAEALRERKPEDLRSLLESFVNRRPKAPAAAGYRLELAQLAQEAGDDAQAAAWLDRVLSAGAAKHVDAATLRQARYNRALLARKQGQTDRAASLLEALLREKGDDALRAMALVELGEVRLERGDRAAAAEAWSRAVAMPAAPDRDALRDRLARVWLAAGDHKKACAQFAALAEKLGGAAKLRADSRRLYARALAETGEDERAAGILAGLSEETGDPATAFEAGLLFERAGQPDRAEPWYVRAAKKSPGLPPAYTKAVDVSVARVRLEAGIGDRGAAYWLSQAGDDSGEDAFAPAAAALRRIAREGALSKADLKAVSAAAATYPADNPRRYSLGAAEALALWRTGADGKRDAAQALRKRVDVLLADYEKHESKLKGEGAGTTIAPAVLYFTRGEALRRLGQYGEALVDYETVLAAYPYNEWPEAGACGAAECYLATGDKDVARAKFREVISTRAEDAGVGTWVKYAKKRLAELGE